MKRPVLSLNERDRRWGLAREMMKANGFDCLIVTGGFDPMDAWFTNSTAGGVVIFPLEGEPVHLVWSPFMIWRELESEKRGIKKWVEDLRVEWAAKQGIVDVLKEKGLDSATIGATNLVHRGPGAGTAISYDVWIYVLEHLPNAKFVDAGIQFAQIYAPKSEEELELARYGAYVGELACEAMINAIKAGANENEVYAAIMETIFRNGANAWTTIIFTGLENLGWGYPIWLSQPQESPVIGKGDLVQAEIFPTYGCIQTQQQMAVATKPVDQTTRELADVSRLSYEEGLKALRAGVKFGDVYEAMLKPLNDAGCWHLTPMVHSMNPLMFISPHFTELDKIPEIKDYKGVHKEEGRLMELPCIAGMIFELEPNACRGKRRVNIGGTVIVTKDGVEELNKIATEMQVV